MAATSFGPRAAETNDGDPSRAIRLIVNADDFGISAAANRADLDLIKAMVHVVVNAALEGTSGVVGHDEERGDELRAIEFPRIKGGKHFDPATPWFADMLRDIGQTS